jgi:hypothetical protein
MVQRNRFPVNSEIDKTGLEMDNLSIYIPKTTRYNINNISLCISINPVP